MSDNSVNQALFSLEQPLDVVVMAAGKGTRMKSRIPKVLQRLAGKPLLGHVLDTAAHLKARSAVVITGHGADEVEAAVSLGSGKLAKVVKGKTKPDINIAKTTVIFFIGFS
jgi:bifunctional UDP-N-acetylglucosamine pyrophosphorylase/glucosamine-1-phosphate N-acetyltransferase